MSGFGPGSSGQNPFEGIFGDLARILGQQSSGDVNWDVARQVAMMLASEGKPEDNVEPGDRIRIENLVRIAELHVAEVTGFDVNSTEVKAVNRTGWTASAFQAWKPVLDALASSLARSAGEPTETEPDPSNPMAAFAGMEQMMRPMLLGMQIGGMVGQLSQRSLTQYDVPIPRQSTSIELLSTNVNAFAEDWSLPIDEVVLFLCVEEVTRSLIFNRPSIRERFLQLMLEYANGFEPADAALEEQFGNMDFSNPEDLPAMLSNPQALLGALQSDGQRRTLVYLDALMAAFVGYVDHVTKVVSQRLIPSAGSLGEAVKRRRVEESAGHRLAEQLLGLELSQATFDRGDAFVAGVIERAGEDGLRKLWESADNLPTPAEIDAPGLWLARIDFPLPEA